MPVGIGGFIPYLGFVDLLRYELTSGKSTDLVASPGPGRVCREELSSDARLLASTCEIGEIQVLNLSSDEMTTISLPEGIHDALAGSVRFSPGGIAWSTVFSWAHLKRKAARWQSPIA